MNRFAARFVAALLFVGAVACTDPFAEARTTAAAPLAQTVVTLTTENGKTHRYRVDLARTEAEQARGLMFRQSMPRDMGMLFPMNPPRMATFWMENTFIPLDIIFVAPDGYVLNIGRGVPKTRDIVASVGPVGWVLELNAGEAKRIGLEPGDRMTVDSDRPLK